MPIAQNVLGLRFGMLVVGERVLNTRPVLVRCSCDCGNTKVIRLEHLKAGKIQSCGCYGNKKSVERFFKHGKSFSKEYTAWKSMKRRCKDKRHNYYHCYGGRGISYDQSWESFDKFYNDMGVAPSGTSLDRIDNNKGYSKENCRWATAKQQSRNTRRNKFFTMKGETKCLSEWCEIYDMPRDIVYRRIVEQGQDLLSSLANRGKVTRRFPK